MKEKELLKLKERIEDAEKSKLRLEGELDSLNKRLKKDWNIKNIKEAETKLEKMKVELKDKSKLIEKKESKLEKMIEAFEDE